MKTLEELCREHKVETDLAERWEKGTPHHPKSKQLMQSLMEVDWKFGNDYFCWKRGGDGDNGETLMYEMDIVFELEDKIQAATSN